MTLAESALATELEAMVPTDTPGSGEMHLATAYGNYMHGATAGAVAIISSAVDATAVPAMAGAMSFASGATAAAGASVLQSGMAAFWTAIAAAPSAFFAGATAITPPTLATLAAALTAKFVANAAPGVTLSHAAAELAAALHAATTGQGTATFPGPVVAPIA